MQRSRRRPPTSGDALVGGDSRTRILRSATRLFARQGFDAVTTREIAADAGLTVATLHYHVGSKADLYCAVLAQINDAEGKLLGPLAAAVDATVHDPTALRRALLRLFDGYIDFLVETPEAAFLWTRRAVATPAEQDPLQMIYGLPLYQQLGAALGRASSAGTIRDVDVHLLLRTYIWATYGFFTGGLLEGPPLEGRLPGPERIARFRAFIVDYVEQMLDLAPHDDLSVRSERSPNDR